ncbi:UNVERIFIED_CONTAM: hypothetical protein GTU68_065615 [Idotea baltica]|nr:hypothetical protein [Idotea baltica]
MPQVERKDVAREDSWNLEPLFSSEDSWREKLDKTAELVSSIEEFRGRLGKSAEVLAQAFKLYLDLSQSVEEIYVYAHLRSDEDTTNTDNLGAFQQATKLYSQFAAATSFINPELLKLDEKTIEGFLEDEKLKPYSRMIERVIRYRPHTLSENEETLLASASEVFSTSSNIFSQLNNADFEFGSVEIDGEIQSLTHGTYSSFLKHKDREIRKKVYNQYYETYNAHKHTLATTLSSSVKKNVYLARTKKFDSAVKASLFSDDVSVDVYTTLVDTIGKSLPALHSYYELRRKLSGLSKLALYDTYVPLIGSVELTHSYEEAVSIICNSLAPLGQEYVETLRAGLGEQRWVDRYENKGKRSGAYSSGCYSSPPYILMNYKSNDIRDVYTLTHEAGHSMHSFLSSKNQAYQDSHYTIFVAEVASTFNEQLLTKELRRIHKDDPLTTAYLINNQLDDIKSTLFRQTMFAEFELFTHKTEEDGQPLTLDTFREYYTSLLTRYFGDAVEFNDIDSLECFRIPHFYSAFYVYKYSTGLAAAVSLSEQVLSKDELAQKRFLNFLCCGGSKYPLELLADAGVNMRLAKPIEDTTKLFSKLVSELEEVMKKLD